MKLLQDRVAIVFAAGGAIGSAVALALAQDGAYVYCSGRTFTSVKAIAEKIISDGGRADSAEVDATDEMAVNGYIREIAERHRRIDIVFNGIGLRAAEMHYGTPSTELPLHSFTTVIVTHAGSQFLTARTAAKYMMRYGTGGTIITLSASLTRHKTPYMAGISAACAAVEGFSRVLAAELGHADIKVICLNPTGMPDTRTIRETYALLGNTVGVPAESMAEQMKQNYLLGRYPTPENIGKLVAFLVTDTGALLNSHIVDADFGVTNVL
jgi:3-oxoacyl-[acyl-carrier protein] reductase